MTHRRDFLAQLAVGAAAFSFHPSELQAAEPSPFDGPWDLSWIDRVKAAEFSAVFNVGEIGDGSAMDFAARGYDGFKEAHGTGDAQFRPVFVFRHFGTALGVNDAMWSKYKVGDEFKITDPSTHAPAERNIFLKDEGGKSASNRIEALQKRGAIVLVCSLALNRQAGRIAQRTSQTQDAVREELKANLIPGAILVPNGIYGVIRAQNAGCAYMPSA
jgi:intracellular sulfur oxidation DsrE/DsrF family protein